MLKRKILFYFVFSSTIVFLFFGLYSYNYRMVFISFLALILFVLIRILEKFLKINMSFGFSLLLYLFIFCSLVLGEVFSFYKIIPFWDNILHFSFGLLCACFSFSFFFTIFDFGKCVKKIFMMSILFSLCFSVFCGTIWEFFEFSMDRFFGYDMQKDTIVNKISTSYMGKRLDKVYFIDGIDNVKISGRDGSFEIEGYLDIGLIDTMEDMFIGMLGSFTFVLFIIIYRLFGCNVFKRVNEFIGFYRL